MGNAFHELTAESLIQGLQTRKWSSLELTSHFLARIKKIDPQLHSVPFLFEAEALEQARESDQRRMEGKALSALDGLPMTIKDSIRIKSSISTYGIWLFRNYRPKTDSQLIEILRRSGIVFLGRTAVPTAAFDWNCWNRVYPECVNPFDARRIPGGSSGGAAAALAKGLTPLELGSDLGGSIRYPAHCCGIYGLRTTDGWLPIEDIGPEGLPTAFRQLLTLGPMARNLADLDIMLERFAERFPRKESTGKFPEGKLRIAYSREIMGMPSEPSTQKLFQAYLDELAHQGHILIEIAPAKNFEELYYVWGIIAGYEYTQAFPKWLRNRLVKKIQAWWMLDHRLGAGPFTTHFKRGMLADKKTYHAACEQRKDIFAETDKFFEEYALWILPVAPSSAIPRALCGKKIQTASGPIEYSKYLGSYTVPTTTLGTPVLTCPIGADELKMPIGVQVHGPRYSDRWLVRALKKIELGFPNRPLK